MNLTGGWKELHIEELHSLYSSLNNVRIMNSRMMIPVGHASRMVKMRNSYKILVGKPERRDNSAGGRIIPVIKLILRK
jgi:hypothetical protein